jgi:hypothetical protein
MESFRNPNYSKPVISKHCNDLKRDWNVFFEFLHEGKIHKIIKREGVNRLKVLDERINAINILQEKIDSCLRFGWNPILDPQSKKFKHQIFYKFYNPERCKPIPKKESKAFVYFYEKH